MVIWPGCTQYSILGMWQTFGAIVFADSRRKSLQTLEVITIQTFAFKVRLVFQNEIIVSK